MAAKDSLSDQGLFVINLVSRSQAIKDSIYSKLKSVSTKLFLTRICELHRSSLSSKECAYLSGNYVYLTPKLLPRLVRSSKNISNTFGGYPAYESV